MGGAGGSGCAEPGAPAERTRRRGAAQPRAEPSPRRPAPKEILTALSPARRLGEDGERATDREAQARTRRIWPARACGVAPPRRRASAGAQGRERSGRAAPVCQQLWGRGGDIGGV